MTEDQQDKHIEAILSVFRAEVAELISDTLDKAGLPLPCSMDVHNLSVELEDQLHDDILDYLESQ